MGRLNRSVLVRCRQLWRRFRSWALPLILTLGVLIGLHSRVQADPAPPKTELQTYLQTNQLELFDSVAEGYPQAFYFFNHRPIQLSHTAYPVLHPVASGQYVAWQGVVDGLGQVFLYDVLTDAQLQLSSLAPNGNISIRGNHVAWQGWDGNHWQIFYYNGLSVRQLTTGPTDAINAVTDGTRVAYAQQTPAGDWQAFVYDPSDSTTVIRQGDLVSTGYPRFNGDGSISTDFVPY